MNRWFLILIFPALLGCGKQIVNVDRVEQIVFDGCEYVVVYDPKYGFSGFQGMAHRGNCTNHAKRGEIKNKGQTHE